MYLAILAVASWGGGSIRMETDSLREILVSSSFSEMEMEKILFEPLS